MSEALIYSTKWKNEQNEEKKVAKSDERSEIWSTKRIKTKIDIFQHSTTATIE